MKWNKTAKDSSHHIGTNCKKHKEKGKIGQARIAAKAVLPCYKKIQLYILQGCNTFQHLEMIRLLLIIIHASPNYVRGKRFLLI